MNRILPRASARRAALALACTLTCTLGAAGAAAADLDVMTQNQYLGADLTPVLNAATAEPFDLAAFS